MDYKKDEIDRIVKDAEFRGKMIEVMKNLNKNQDDLMALVDKLERRIRLAEDKLEAMGARQRILWIILSILFSIIIGVWIHNYFII